VTETRSYPRRDADGRLATVGGGSRFGSGSGWLIVILPIWAFVEEFRSARHGAARVLVALVAAGLGVLAGLVAAGLAATAAPALVSGGVGAVVFSVVYAVVWFYGLRWVAHRAGSSGA
jgi:hypothetical protein